MAALSDAQALGVPVAQIDPKVKNAIQPDRPFIPNGPTSQLLSGKGTGPFFTPPTPPAPLNVWQQGLIDAQKANTRNAMQPPKPALDTTAPKDIAPPQTPTMNDWMTAFPSYVPTITNDRLPKNIGSAPLVSPEQSMQYNPQYENAQQGLMARAGAETAKSQGLLGDMLNARINSSVSGSSNPLGAIAAARQMEALAGGVVKANTEQSENAIRSMNPLQSAIAAGNKLNEEAQGANIKDISSARQIALSPMFETEKKGKEAMAEFYGKRGNALEDSLNSVAGKATRGLLEPHLQPGTDIPLPGHEDKALDIVERIRRGGSKDIVAGQGGISTIPQHLLTLMATDPNIAPGLYQEELKKGKDANQSLLDFYQRYMQRSNK